MKLLIISPVRDEEQYIHFLVDSMLQQKFMDYEWIIVDDGSTDETVNILKQEVRGIDSVRIVSMPNRGYRLRGEGVVNSINHGLSSVDMSSFQLLAKMDGDISFPENYFSSVLEEFSRDPKLGITSGDVYELKNDKWESSSISLPIDFVRGQCKVYRMECFDSIGGLDPYKGWDGVDNVKAIINGWRVCRLPYLKVLHHAPIGSKENLLRSKYWGGVGAYYMGSDPIHFLLRSFSRINETPVVLSCIALLVGYFGSLLMNKPKADEKVRNYIKSKERELLKDKIIKW